MSPKSPGGAGIELPLTQALVARQPICDRDQKTFAYELLFRQPGHSTAVVDNPERATAQVIVNSFMEIGIDHLVGHSTAFINVTPQFILGNHCRSLPKDRVVLEILEDTLPSPELLKALDALKADGYRFALDDYAFDARMLPLIPYCSFIKVDVRQSSPEVIKPQLDALKRLPAVLLAEKVETIEEFEFYRDADFDYFQGYFFCKPRTITSARISPSQVAVCRLLAKLYQPEINPHDIETIVGEDLALSYQLLRYINSACLAISKQIESIGHAVRLVGIEHIRRLASLLMLASVDAKPRELVTTSLVRGRMCELIAQRLNQRNTEAYFTIGLLSTLPAFLDASMESALDLLPLSDEVKGALLAYRGRGGEILCAVHAYEQGDWQILDGLRIDTGLISEAYLMALEFAENLTRELSPIPGTGDSRPS